MGQPEANIGTVGHIAHGKTTLVHALTGKWTLEHSEELKRGITIRLGYADFTIFECPKHGLTTLKICPHCKGKCSPARKLSFVDAPGHETLMATMLAGAAIMDGAILVISANEPCPQPQTKEHLMALNLSGIENVIIVQNKIDLVDDKQALENYNKIKNFVKGTVAENSPIVPISAHHKVNLDILLEAVQKYIPTPKRDLSKDPIMLIARSFDINKPGSEMKDLKGGVFGGSLIQGVLKDGNEIEICPGIKTGKQNKEVWESIKTKITSLRSGAESLKEVKPGGNVAVSTELDPSMTKSDSLSGSVIALPGKTPPLYSKLKLDFQTLERVVGDEKESKIEPFKTGEPLMLNAWTAKSLGIITSARKNELDLDLKIPICINKGAKVAISRKIGIKWRLVGCGIIS
jgi:translation initiation factor 2 subunit 3